jgi:RNA polymerase sigma factor (sigma-70 family)
MEQLRNLQKLRSELRSASGEEPTTEQLAEASGLEIRQVRTLLAITNTCVSLDQPVAAGASRTVGDCLAAENGPSQVDAVIRGDEVRRIRELLEDLPPRQQQILSLRFGFVGDRPMSLREIGECVGVSRERVRQLEKHALQELRNRFEEVAQ